MHLEYQKQQNTDKIEIAFEAALAIAFTVIIILSLFSLFSVPVSPIGGVGSITGSIVFFWNSVADTLGQSDYIILPKFTTDVTGGGTIFLLLLIVLSVLNYLIIMSRLYGFLIIWVIYVIIFPLIFDINISFGYYAGFIGLLILTFSYMTAIRSINKKALISITALLAVTAVSVLMMIPDSYGRPQAAQDIAGNIDKAVYTIRYGDTLLGGGDLYKLGNRKDSKSDALEVTMSKPESLYLRGYIGSDLTGNKWNDLDSVTYYQERGLFYWLHYDGFSGLDQLNLANELTGGKSESNNIRIKNLGADRKHIYTPYEITGYEGLDSRNYSDSHLGSQKLFGSRNYEYTASQNLVKDWTSLAAKIFSIKNSQEVTKYKMLESNYNVKVYKNYTKIPQAEWAILAGAIGPAGDQTKGHVGYKQAINLVRTYLEDNIVYTEKVKPVGNENFIEVFFDKKKGYDVHYATAATSMFRYYGIPARYVEGYLITPKDVKGKTGVATVKITNKNLHAWTEIYVDALGWVPIEVTPEYYGVMQETDMSKGLENISSPDPFDQDDNTRPDTNKVSAVDEAESGFPWVTILISLVLLLLLILVVILARFAVLRLVAYLRRRRAFRDEDNRKAICAMYAYILAKYGGLDGAIKDIGDRAAYSMDEMTDKDRSNVYEEMMALKSVSKCYNNSQWLLANNNTKK